MSLPSSFIRVIPVVILLGLTPSQHAWAQSSAAVVISYDESSLDSVARRISAELRSAGRDRVVLQRGASLEGCPSHPRSDALEAQVGIVLKREDDTIVNAEICHSPQTNQLNIVTTRGSLEKEGDFAIVVTEALHGLLIAPTVPAPHPQKASEPAAMKKESRSKKRDGRAQAASLLVQSRIVLDAPTGDFWLGVVPAVNIPLNRNISFAAEVLIGFRPISYADEFIELKSHLAWARFGLLGAHAIGPALLGWTISTGLFSNRAKAHGQAPYEGGSDGAFGAVLGAGGHVELPARGPVFVSGAMGVSMLLPRLNYQLSSETTSSVGALLIEGSLGFGVRLGQ